jgi:hypothetical protein
MKQIDMVGLYKEAKYLVKGLFEMIRWNSFKLLNAKKKKKCMLKASCSSPEVC